LWGYVKQFDRAARHCHAGRRGNCEYALVLHFTKDRGGGARQGAPTAYGSGSHPDPAANPSGYRYSAFYATKRQEALSFAWVLNHYPLSLEVVRGLDLCTDELGVPNWVLFPLVQYVRQAGEAASRFLRRVCGLDVPPLNTTVHVGEDFVHLLSGFRRVDEALHYLNLREGDRIGHGLALGVDPRDWARRSGRIPLAREERLFDLVWEWDWYARGGANPPSGRRHYLGHEILRLASEVFGDVDEHLAPHLLAKLVHDLHGVETLCRAGFPDRAPNDPAKTSPDRGLQLLIAYLTNREVFRQGREVEWVDPSGEGDVLAGLQVGLRRKVAGRGVTVEVNPTSNLLIGDLEDLTRHPLWRLRPPRESEEFPPVSVCIGSDDPLTFATNLREEYQLVHDALLLGGLTDEEARNWLERTRASGLETRFTLPRTFQRRLGSIIDLEDHGITLPL
jgi:hypothetical protein